MQCEQYPTAAELDKLEPRIGTLKAFKQHPSISNNIILLFDLGKREQDIQIVVNKKEFPAPANKMGKQYVLFEIQPITKSGIESQAALLATYNGKNRNIFLIPERKAEPGTKVIQIGGE